MDKTIDYVNSQIDSNCLKDGLTQAALIDFLNEYDNKWWLPHHNIILALISRIEILEEELDNFNENYPELKEKLQRADYEIWKMVDHKTDENELIRLRGKHEGIGVALSYIDEISE